MTTDSVSQSRLLAGKTIYAALAAIKENGGRMRRKEVQDWVLENTDLTPWELEAAGKDSTPRWVKYLGYVTLDASRAGYMEKDSGLWTITEEGMQAVESMDPLDLYQAARDGYREWQAEQEDDEDDLEDPSNRVGVTWTPAIIFHSGLNLLARSPGRQMDVGQFLQRLPGLLPEDACEALNSYDEDWAWEYGYRKFYRAVKAGWLVRQGGIWSLTTAGEKAVSGFPEPKALWETAKAMQGTGGSDDVGCLSYLGDIFNSGGLPQTLYSTQSASVQHLVSQVVHKTLALPDLQRPFVWPNKKVRDLLDSMFQGFPFGYILTWRSPLDVRTKQIGTGEEGEAAPQALVIDGQQRLTSLFAVMTGKPVLDKHFKKREIQIAFHPIQGVFKVSDAALKKSPEWISNVTGVFANSMGALSVVQEYLKSLETAREIGPEHRAAAEQNIQRLVNLRNIQLGILEISQDADEEQVAEIFVRINSKGQNLRQADFILTLLAVFWEEGRKQLEEFAKACKIPSEDTVATPFNRLLQPGPDDMIRVVVAVSHRRARLSAAYQVLRGKDSKTGRITDEARDENLRLLEAAQVEVLNPGNWHEFLKTLEAAGYRRDWLIQSTNAALMSYSLFLIGRRSYGMSVQELRKIIGRWFAFVSVTGRYSGSPESIMEEDLARLREIKDSDGEAFIQALESAIESELTEDFWNFTLPARLESSNIRTITSFMAAQCKLGAKALYSELSVADLLNPERQSTRKDLEVHHLFPKAWLKANGVTNQREYNQIANQTLVEWSINSEISDKDPAEYALTYEQNTDDQARTLHAMPERWWEMDYQEFLTARRKLMAGVIRKAFEKDAT
jgi:hypothetical protein